MKHRCAETIKRLYAQGFSMPVIAMTLGRSLGGIHLIMKKNNIAAKKKGWHLYAEHRKPILDSTRQKLSDSKAGEKNPMWKSKCSYKTLHDWVRRHLKKPVLCHDCNAVHPYDVANISQEYQRDLNDWEWLCRSCHMKKDGRLEKLINSKKPKLNRKPNGQFLSLRRLR